MSLFGLIKRGKPAVTGQPAPAKPVMRELAAPAETPVDAVPEGQTRVEPRDLTSSDVRRMLFDAIARRDERRLKALCREHRDLIDEHADLWLMVPDVLLPNPTAAQWYRDGMEMLTRLGREPSSGVVAATA